MAEIQLLWGIGTDAPPQPEVQQVSGCKSWLCWPWHASGYMFVVDPYPTWYIFSCFHLFLIKLNPSSYLGLANGLNQDPHPLPVLPVPTISSNKDDDDDRGDILGPMVESNVDLVKTIHKWLCVPSLSDHILTWIHRMTSMPTWHFHYPWWTWLLQTATGFHQGSTMSW